MKSTWIIDPAVESVLLAAFDRVDQIFSTFFEVNALSDEERLTGAFVQVLIKETASINNVLSAWSKMVTTAPVFVKLYYKDVTVNRSEKKWGADLAFVLDVKVPGRNEFKKTILLQAKKMQSRSVPEGGILFENHWRIDIPQAKKLRNLTSSSFYILYNPLHGFGIRILPATSVISISKATENKTSLYSPQVMPCSRRFSDFMLYDFIGCWAGDYRTSVLKKTEGSNDQYSANHVIWVKITSESQQ